MTNKTYYQKNKERIRKQNKEYYETHKEQIKKQHREYYHKSKYYQKNKKRLDKSHRKYYLKNKKKILAQRKKRQQELYDEKLREYHEKYYRDNRVKINKYVKMYKRKKYDTDENFRIRERLRTSLREALKQFSKTGKIRRAREYGIDYEAIIRHLGSPPNNKVKWHIDHIIPLSRFDLNNPEQIKIAFSPQNLRWLPAKENLIKSNKLVNVWR